MLTEFQAVDYLLQRGLLTRDDVVQRGLVVQDASRRNHNFTMRVRGGSAYFVKQSDSRQSRKTVGREAACYRLLWTNPADFAARHMPRLCWFDSSEDLLVLECLDAEPLNAGQSVEATHTIACAGELGRALARLHDATLDRALDLELPPPWVLSVGRPPADLLAELSSTAIAAVTIAQQIPDFIDLLSDLAWPGARPTPIHGDIRWDNCLTRRYSDSDSARVFIVDWELAGFGDPCWDVGCVISEYVRSWLRSLPAMSSMPVTESIALAGCPLSTVQPAIAAFWSSYSNMRRSARDETCLLRSVQWSAARLIQSAIESAQASAQLSGTGVYTLQLAENILRDPRRAALRLLRLPLG